MTRSKLTIAVIKLVMESYPMPWRTKEIAAALQSPRRTIDRCLLELTEAKLLAKNYHAYSLPLELMDKFYKAQAGHRTVLNKQIKIYKGEQDEKTDRIEPPAEH